MIKPEVKIRIPHTKDIPYRILTNKAFYDSRLTPLAKILLMHLLGKHSENYTPTIPALAKQLSSTKDKINRAIACLRKYGYLTSKSLPHTGKKYGTQSWWIYELPEYMQEDLTNSNNQTGYDLTNSKTTNSNNQTLYNNIDCGGITTPPQSTNEENKTILPPKPFNEMNEEELSKYFPF